MNYLNEPEILQHIREDGPLPSDRSLLPKYLQVARQNGCSKFIEKLARSLDAGATFFSDARSRALCEQGDEGVLFYRFLNEVHSKKVDVNDAEHALRIASSSLLLFVSERAVRSSWIRHLSYDVMKNTITLRPLPFGTEYDVALLTLTWIEWHHPFCRDSERMVTLLSDLFAVQLDKMRLSLIAMSLAKSSLEGGTQRLQRLSLSFLRASADLARATMDDRERDAAVDDLLHSSPDRTLLATVLAKCWTSVIATKTMRVPDRDTFEGARLYLQQNMLFEYNRYVGAYRLIALPPADVQPTDFFRIVALDPNTLISIHPHTRNVYRLDLSKVFVTESWTDVSLCADKYPGHIWQLLHSVPEVETNVFIDGKSVVKITTHSDRPSEWSISWHRGAKAGRDLDMKVTSPFSSYCSQIFAILRGFRLVVVGAAHLGKTLVPNNVEYVLDLMTGHFEESRVSEPPRETASRMTMTVDFLPDVASCQTAWSAGIPVVLKSLPAHPPALCIGEFFIPSSREGFWVREDSNKAHLRSLDWLNWRTSGKFAAVDFRRRSTLLDTDQDASTLSALLAMNDSSPEKDCSNLASRMETLQV